MALPSRARAPQHPFASPRQGPPPPVTVPKYAEFAYVELSAPVPVTEAVGDVLVLTMVNSELQQGIYRAISQFVVSFSGADDRVHFKTTGTWPTTEDYVIESKDAGERFNIARDKVVTVTGPIEVNLFASVEGPGPADVVIEEGGIFIQRIK